MASKLFQENRRQVQRLAFPLGDNLLALICVSLADLTQYQSHKCVHSNIVDIHLCKSKCGWQLTIAVWGLELVARWPNDSAALQVGLCGSNARSWELGTFGRWAR